MPCSHARCSTSCRSLTLSCHPGGLGWVTLHFPRRDIPLLWCRAPDGRLGQRLLPAPSCPMGAAGFAVPEGWESAGGACSSRRTMAEGEHPPAASSLSQAQPAPQARLLLL